MLQPSQRETDGRRQDGDRCTADSPEKGRHAAREYRRHQSLSRRLRETFRTSIVRENECIVSVPGLDIGESSNVCTDGVVGVISPGCKLGTPIGMRTFVDMMLATLTRDGRREEHEVAMPDEAVDECPGIAFRNVLRHFETFHEFKLSLQIEGLGNVSGAKICLRDKQRICINISAIKPLQPGNPLALPLGQPDAATTPNIKH